MALTLKSDFVNSPSLVSDIGPTYSITRATDATRTDSSGNLDVVGSGVAAFNESGDKGLNVWEARTNLALHNEDISNAVWVASNITKGTDSVTDPRGNANTNVRLTATAGNGTLLQSITSASETRSYAVYMKRVTGTGNIDLTVDGGSTWTTKTLTASWQRFYISQAAVTDPQFGVRIVTSGDEIDFYGSQLENGAFPTPVIFTTTASVTRNADAISAADVTWFNKGGPGTLYAHVTQTIDTGQRDGIVSIDNTGSGNAIYWRQEAATSSYTLTTRDAFGPQVSASLLVADTVDAQAVAGYDVDDIQIYVDGSARAPVVSNDVPNTVTQIQIGKVPADNYYNGLIKEIRYYDTRLTNTQLEDMSNGIFPVETRHLNVQLRHNRTTLRHKDTTLLHNDVTLVHKS